MGRNKVFCIIYHSKLDGIFGEREDHKLIDVYSNSIKAKKAMKEAFDEAMADKWNTSQRFTSLEVYKRGFGIVAKDTLNGNYIRLEVEDKEIKD